MTAVRHRQRHDPSQPEATAPGLGRHLLPGTANGATYPSQGQSPLDSVPPPSEGCKPALLPHLLPGSANGATYPSLGQPSQDWGLAKNGGGQACIRFKVVRLGS
jgi:hypothetical protein